MDQQTSRHWYKKKRYIIPIAGIVGLIGISSLGSSTPLAVQEIQVTNPQVQPLNIPSSSYQSEEKTVTTPVIKQETKVAPTTNSNLSNDNYYTNVDGNTVHSPAYSNSVPPNATARCRDGTYSFSQSRRGTCSSHGGVAQWL